MSAKSRNVASVGGNEYENLFRIPKSSYVSEEDSIGDNPVSRLHEFLQSHGFDRNRF